MGRRTAKGDIYWYIPGQKRPIAYSTIATRNLIAVLAEDGGTIAELQCRIRYFKEAKAVLQAYIDRGYGDVEARKWFKY